MVRRTATWVLAVVLVAMSGCGADDGNVNAFAPLARTYVKAFAAHDWQRVCALGPAEGVRGFSGPRGCAGRMARLYRDAAMRFDGAITGSFVGTSTTRIKGSAREFAVTLNGESRVLIVVRSQRRDAVFLYADCAPTIRTPPRHPVGGCLG